MNDSSYEVTKTQSNLKLPPGTLLFLHIPKTAGTSLRVELEKKVKCTFDYGRNPKTSPLVKQTINKGNTEAFIQIISTYKFRAICGHFLIEKYISMINDEVKIITFLRDPVQRIVSLYNHFCRHYGYKKPLRDFAQNPIFFNEQSKKIKGLDIEKFFFLGITEHYDASIQLFNQITNMNISNVRTNVNPDRTQDNYEIDEACLKLIETNNQQDILLYQKSKQLFYAKLARAGISLI